MFDGTFLAALVILFEASVAAGNVEAPLTVAVFEGGTELYAWVSAEVDVDGAELVPADPAVAGETPVVRLGRTGGDPALYGVAATDRTGVVASVGAVTLRDVIDRLHAGSDGAVTLTRSSVPVSGADNATGSTMEAEGATTLLTAPDDASLESAPVYRVRVVGNTVLVNDDETGRLFVAIRSVQ